MTPRPPTHREPTDAEMQCLPLGIKQTNTMGQKAKSFKISHDLAEASVLRAKYIGYPSWASYVKTLIRRDIGGEVFLKGTDLKRLTLREEDALDYQLSRMVKEAISRLPAE